MKSIDALHRNGTRRDLPPFRSGDTVRVHVKITEGDKERIQVFEGVVLSRRGSGAGATFTVRKVSSGVGVERVFPLESPNVAKVEIKSRGHVRRSRLYYLRQRAGKKARLRSKLRDVSGLVSEEEALGSAEEAAAAQEAAEGFAAPEASGDGESAAGAGEPGPPAEAPAEEKA